MSVLCKKAHGTEEKFIKCVTKNADQSIRAAAQRKQDQKLLGKILNGDLIVREAHYHTSCRKSTQGQMIGMSAVIKMKSLLKN